MDRNPKTSASKIGVDVATLTKADVRTSIQMGQLSDEEERYVRMRFGISEPASAVLSRRGTTFPETRARLALIEAGLVADRLPPATNPVKQRIIDRLRNS